LGHALLGEATGFPQAAGVVREVGVKVVQVDTEISS
jgi:hypothetical protein